MIFFPNNGGREALQFYLVAALNKFFNLELNFAALKIVTITAGFLSLPFLYLIGKELINKRAGLIALAFGAIAYWPNVVSRIGMRLPFYILFTAALLYFLLRGLQTGRRNYFVFSGITLGFSLYGYSANRILPLIVLVAVVLFLLHNSSKGRRHQIIVSTLVLFVIAAAIAMPMLRYALEEPDSLLFRTLTRMGTVERPLSGSPFQIFFTNLGRALIMFSWDNGEIWPVSVPHRPALDLISAALFWIGAATMLIRYIRSKQWLDLFWLLSIPILMLPSIMSLAFPAENPNLYRTGGVMIPVFIIVSIVMDGLISTIRDRHAKIGPHLAWFVLAIFLCLSAIQNFDLVFKDYYEQYRAAAWNSSEMAEVVKEFEDANGSIDTVWVMAYPHWVDTRLIGIIAGHPLRNFVLFPEQVDDLPESTSAKLFMIKPVDETSLNVLTSTFPSGILEEFTSEVESKNFLIYYVPQQPDNPSN